MKSHRDRRVDLGILGILAKLRRGKEIRPLNGPYGAVFEAGLLGSNRGRENSVQNHTFYHNIPHFSGLAWTHRNRGYVDGKTRHPRNPCVPTLGGSSALERGLQTGPFNANDRGLSHIVSYYHTMLMDLSGWSTKVFSNEAYWLGVWLTVLSLSSL